MVAKAGNSPSIFLLSPSQGFCAPSEHTHHALRWLLIATSSHSWLRSLAAKDGFGVSFTSFCANQGRPGQAVTAARRQLTMWPACFGTAAQSWQSWDLTAIPIYTYTILPDWKHKTRSGLLAWLEDQQEFRDAFGTNRGKLPSRNCTCSEQPM